MEPNKILIIINQPKCEVQPVCKTGYKYLFNKLIVLLYYIYYYPVKVNTPTPQPKRL